MFDASSISSPEALERRLCELGLFPHTESKLAEFPAELHPACGRGIGIWQYPCQFARYLLFLRDRFAESPILSYVEVGVAAGGTFVATREFLRFLCREAGIPEDRVRCVGVDPAGPGRTVRGGATPFTAAFEAYLEGAGDTVRFLEKDSAVAIPELVSESGPFDLVLVDGDHSYAGVDTDHRLLGDDGARFIVFHDVASDACPGVVRKWGEVCRANPGRTAEFCQQYPSLSGSFLGIGVLRADAPKPAA